MMKASEIDSSLEGKGLISGATARNVEVEASTENALLLEHAYRVGEEWVVCRLYRVAGTPPLSAEYKLDMEGFGMFASSALGRDRSAARAIYDALVRNTVTPCALEDVLRDWREMNPPVGLWE